MARVHYEGFEYEVRPEGVFGATGAQRNEPTPAGARFDDPVVDQAYADEIIGRAARLPQFFQVTRYCCTSGDCLTCRARANGTKRKRVVHADNLDERMADRMVKGWAAYEPKKEIMP